MSTIRAAQLRQGDIIEGIIPPPRGKTKESRPGIIITATADISEDEMFILGVSTSWDRDDQIGCFPLPFHPDGNCCTKFRVPCAAVLNWHCKIATSQIHSIRGYLKKGELIKLLVKFNYCHGIS